MTQTGVISLESSTYGAVPNAVVHLRSGGVSVLLDLLDGQVPAILFWGADLGALTIEDARTIALSGPEPASGNGVDAPTRVAIVPEQSSGWYGRPGLSGHRGGEAWAPQFRTVGLVIDDISHPAQADAQILDSGPARVRITTRDIAASLDLVIELELLGSGLLRCRAELFNFVGTYALESLSLTLPVPTAAREILDFAGRWTKERVPQRRDLVVGIHDRENRKGRTGSDAATVLSVGEPGFGFARGEIWGVHVGFSGNHRHYAERTSSGTQLIGGGELLLPGEIAIDAGGSYRTPWIYAAYGDGLDDQAHRFHDWLRSRPEHPRGDRLVTLNVWEAVYFDHDLAKLTALADLAAQVGVERYVLDDGWFRHRRDDFAGLGDWYVDEEVWPDGLHPLVDHVRGLGMQFGLWFEPEMINEDSDLARAHPDWIMRTPARMPVSARNQQVLNLAIPEAYEYIWERMTALLDEYPISYIKWDHNRDLVDAGTLSTGRPAVHDQTLAVYRLMDALRQRYPDLEIESCSSGGGRVDLGIIERTDRVWVSDCIDPLERHDMNRWTMQLLPAELLGSHIASPISHTTGRRHDLSFRAGSALFGHLGIEWDLRQAGTEELAELRRWIELYTSLRGILHTGSLVRGDDVDAAFSLQGSVDASRSRAVVFLSYLARSDVTSIGNFVLPGLDADRHYRVRPVIIGASPLFRNAPAWFGDGPDFQGVVLSGAALARVGLRVPDANPEHVIVLSVEAV